MESETTKELWSKRYIGDAVYVKFDGYHLVLTTEDGTNVTNRICLEPQVYETLLGYAKNIIDGYNKVN